LTFTSGAERRHAAVAQVFVDDLAAPQLDEADAHHLLRVRRLSDGELVVAADGTGAWRSCRIEGGALALDGQIEVEVEQGPSLCVAFAPVKGDRSEWAVAKLTELGCDRIVALATERAAVRWGAGAAERALERWARVAREAACQSRRVRLPVLEGPVEPAAFAQEPSVAMAVPGGAALSGATATVLIGPEGGWSEPELALGIVPVGLAPNVLRTETAAVAAAVLMGAIRAGTVAQVERNGTLR
jgi:16S rRNA (uracil1498-N3)-methyltransferase